MARRSGVTLVEVLVAIFVMGIGLIALLTLFPIGILQMAVAIRKDKCTQSANQAHSISIIQSIRNDSYVTNFNVLLGAGEPTPPLGTASIFKNPQPGTLPDADDYGPSYPVFVDPYGYRAFPGAPANFEKDWVAGSPGYLRRRPVTFVPVNSNPDILRWFTLMDEPIFYGDDPQPVGTQPPGTPRIIPPGTTFMRDMHFSWAYLLRRPMTSDPSVVDCSIVVFENRPISLTGASILPEVAFTNSVFDPGSNTITVTYGALAPNVRPGDWVYDATIQFAKAGASYPYPDIQSYFYRVVAVDQLAGNQVRIEVQQSIRPQRVDKTGVAAYPGTMIVMEGVAEVFPKGPVRLP